QLYWSMDFEAASHRKIGQWWASTAPGTHLYLGNGLYKVENNADPAWMKKSENPKQLAFARKLREIDGNIFFSAKSLMGRHEKLGKKLRRGFYRLPAQNPAPLNHKIRKVPIPTIT